MTAPTADPGRPRLRYVEEITDPGTGEVTTYSAGTPEELEAAIAADWGTGGDAQQ